MTTNGSTATKPSMRKALALGALGLVVLMAASLIVLDQRPASAGTVVAAPDLCRT